MKQVRFSRLVISPVYGNCGPGDVVRCDDEFARHVVDELACAEYIEAPAPIEASLPAESAPVQTARRGRRAKQGADNG